MARRKESGAGDPQKYVDGENVPDIYGDDVSDEEVDVTGGVDVGGLIAVGVDGVAAVLGTGVGGFDLHAEETVSGFDDEVVAVALAPGFGDAEAEAGCLVQKSGFGDLAATLGGEIGHRICHCHRAKQKARADGPRLFFLISISISSE